MTGTESIRTSPHPNAHRRPGPTQTEFAWVVLAGGVIRCMTGGGKTITTPTERNSPLAPSRTKFRDGNKIPRRGAGINTAGIFIQPKWLHNSWHSGHQTESEHSPWSQKPCRPSGTQPSPRHRCHSKCCPARLFATWSHMLM